MSVCPSVCVYVCSADDQVTEGATAEIVDGVKYLSPFNLIHWFNLVKGFVVDPMHCVDLGVMRQLAALWFDSSYVYIFVFSKE